MCGLFVQPLMWVLELLSLPAEAITGCTFILALGAAVLALVLCYLSYLGYRGGHARYATGCFVLVLLFFATLVVNEHIMRKTALAKQAHEMVSRANEAHGGESSH